MRTNADKVVGDITGHHDPKPGLHYKLSCYICGHACTKPSPFEGWVTFERIFQQRPDGCRFAIAQHIVMEMRHGKVAYRSSDRWICWDLLDDGLLGGIHSFQRPGLVRPPPPIWTSPSEEGLIMRAMASYDR